MRMTKERLERFSACRFAYYCNYGLKAEEIPLAAKILAIADTYSAITMRRSYKAPRTHEEAMEIIRDVAGTQLDKDLVEIFLTIPKEELVKCIPEEVKY